MFFFLLNKELKFLINFIFLINLIQTKTINNNINNNRYKFLFKIFNI